MLKEMPWELTVLVLQVQGSMRIIAYYLVPLVV